MGAQKFSVSMPESLFARMEARMAVKGHTSPSAYLQELVREDAIARGQPLSKPLILHEPPAQARAAVKGKKKK